MRGFRPAVVDADLDEQVFGRPLGVLDKDVKVTVLVEHAGVQKLVLKLGPAAATAGFECLSGEGRS